ncbi:MAG: cyclic nucleotide-binding domain-containing protein [Bacteroidota bacterium]
MHILKANIKALSGGTEAEVQQIWTALTPLDLAKDQFILQPPQICWRYYFIEHGAVRLYYRKEHKDYTAWIGTQGQIFTELDSYLHEQACQYYLQAIEPSRVLTIAKTDSDELARQLPAYNTLLRKTVEMAFVHITRNIVAFQSEAASERYDRLENEKNWLTRFPLKYLSSFLGITQSSLSRLRANREKMRKP